ncbi:MAG: adenylate/guanylate cyclase domain-containing protein, partial [Acidimicrobiia bacterium]|nr:adenylate/guanylate cyclase domain-containing protein [Acidimicrobiia bacterium]
RSLIHQALAEQHITAGDTATGAELALRALADAEASGDHTARAFALYATSFADHTDLHLDNALLGMHAAQREADASGDWWVQDIMQARLALYLLTAGHIDESDDAARLAADAAARRHEHSNQAIGNYVRTAAALLRGDFDAFDTLAASTRREAERSGYVLTDLWSTAAAVLGHLYRGDPAAAAQAADCWPNPIPSGLAALRAAPAILGLPAPVTLRRPRRPTQISVGFYAASVEAAVSAGIDHGLDEAAEVLEQATAYGFEYPLAWPTSLTRIRAELALARGEASEARLLFREATRRATDHGAQLELARVLAGTARLLQTYGSALDADPADAADAALRARTLASLIGINDRILRLDPAPSPDPARIGTPAAVLVTDIVGSTTLSRQLGDLAYFELVMAHFELVRASLRRWSGREFSESGDGLLAWFEEVPSALEAAHEIRHRARAAGGALGIKVSVAAGPTLLRAGRPYGLLPSRACRLLDNARPGEVVLDATVAAALPPHFSVSEHRLVDLRGIGSHPLAVLAPPRD